MSRLTFLAALLCAPLLTYAATPRPGDEDSARSLPASLPDIGSAMAKSDAISCQSRWCGEGVELDVLDATGQPVPLHADRGYGTLSVSEGTRIRIVNRNVGRMMVLFAVNGLNPLDGRPALRGSKGFVIPGHGSLEVNAVALPGGTWFSPTWRTSGDISVNVYRENPTRPMLGGRDYQPPPSAMEYVKDERGDLVWVPPTGFPFRYAAMDLNPSGSTYWRYVFSQTTP